MTNMNQAKKSKMTIWGVGAAACAVVAFSIFAYNGSNGGMKAPVHTSAQTHVEQSTGQSIAKPATTAKRMVNIEGTIDEVSADGTSFRVGSLWVAVNEATEYGITGPTAPPASEQLISKEFKVGNTVSGFTQDDVASGQVTAVVLYNNF